jgi:perosamine synthetase
MKITWSEPCIGERDFYALKSCFATRWISQGAQVQEFEGRIAAAAGREYCVAVNSGTSALICLLIALGTGPEAEVIIPAMSFIALPHAVHFAGALPVLADIDETTGVITSATVRPCLTERTKAVIAIDYSGHMNDFDELYALCRERHVPFVVDAASSFLATRNGARAGSLGEAAIFSFHSAKPITTGEGGAIVTNDRALCQALREIRNYGEEDGRKYVYHRLGANFRMTDLAAALGIAQMVNCVAILERRRYVVQRYLASRVLREHAYLCFTDPRYVPNGFSFTVLVQQRDALRQSLAEAGIETRSMWAPCVDEQPIYATLPLRRAAAGRGARSFSRACLSLPVHCSLDDRAIDFVIATCEKQVSEYETSTPA